MSEGLPVNRRTACAVFALAGVSLLTSCSSPSGGSAAQGTSSQGSGKVAKIVVIAPLSGPDSSNGAGARNSVELAVRQANARGAIPGWTLKVQTIDDADPTKSAAAVKKLTTDDDVVAVVGSVYSGATKAILPTLTPAGIPVLSPSATNPTLTMGDAYDTKPRRTYPSFFRLSAPDDAHGPAVARYLREQGVTNVYTTDDGDTYGTGLNKAFTAAFTKQKGKIAGNATLPASTDRGYAEAVGKIVAAKPQAVFYGGLDTEAAKLSLTARAAGLQAPIAGGDGILTAAYVPMSGAMSGGDLGTSGGHPIEESQQGRQYVEDYRHGGFAEPTGPYGALAYNAANATVAALTTSLPATGNARASRPETVKALASVSFDGANGKVAFDRFGDISPRVVTVGRLTGGQWVPAKTYAF